MYAHNKLSKKDVYKPRQSNYEGGVSSPCDPLEQPESGQFERKLFRSKYLHSTSVS